MALRSIFKSLLPLILLAGCADLPRDNPLDPRNPNSFSAWTIFVEAFVNTNNPFDYNETMLEALDDLQNRYPEIEIAEYHRNTQNETDPHHLNESELLYSGYLDALGADLKGVPDVFFNGIRQRVQGASTVESALLRLEQALLQEMGKSSEFSVEVDLNQSPPDIVPGYINSEVTIARLGDIERVRLKIVTTEDFFTPNHRRVVTHVVRHNAVVNLDPGEQKTIIMSDFLPRNCGVVRILFLLTDEEELNVYQCKAVNL